MQLLNRLRTFERDLAQLGFEVVDCWRCLENCLEIPYHPELSIYFCGMFLRRACR